MKVAVIQMNCITNDKNANFKIAAPLIEDACHQGARLIVLPELFNTGYCCTEKDWELAENISGETASFLRSFSDKYSCSIMGGFVEKSVVSGLVFNSLLYVSPDQKTHIYRKMYLWGDEKNRFLKGDTINVWDMAGAKIAPLICYEAGFPELAKLAALRGADILCYSAAFGEPRLYVWDLATRARALETGCYVLASNHSSTESGLAFCGHSRIVDPMGNIICETTEDNSVICADIDLETLYMQRNCLPYLRDIDTDFIGNEYIKIKRNSQ